MTDVTNQYAAFAANLYLDDLPDDVRVRAKLLLADTVGLAIRSRHDGEATPAMMRAVRALGLGNGNCSVFGDRSTYVPAGAALVNSALAHSMDFDDTHAAAAVHPTAPVLGAAMAAAEIVGASGEDLLVGLVAGYEIICRLGQAIVPGNHYDCGFHPTATCGAFAATAATGRIMGLTADQIVDAFGICLSQASGSIQFLANGAHTKSFQVGHAAMAGLTAAFFAREGYRGAECAIEGKYGFLTAYARNANREVAALGLGDEWETLNIAIKPYPGCRFTHALVDAAIEITDRHAIDLDRIQAIELGLSSKGAELTAEPEDAKRQPESLIDAQYSAQFAVAVALRERGFTWDDYARHLGNPDTQALLRKIAAIRDPKVEREYPRTYAGSLRVTMEDGTNIESFVRVPKGEPEHPLTEDEVRAKFGSMVRPSLCKAAEAALFHAIVNLETHGPGDLYRHSRPAMLLEAAGD